MIPVKKMLYAILFCDPGFFHDFRFCRPVTENMVDLIVPSDFPFFLVTERDKGQMFRTLHSVEFPGCLRAFNPILSVVSCVLLMCFYIIKPSFLKCFTGENELNTWKMVGSINEVLLWFSLLS